PTALDLSESSPSPLPSPQREGEPPATASATGGQSNNVALRLDREAKLELDFDLAALLNVPRPLSFANDGSSTHSRDGDPIAAALVANLPGAFHLRRISAMAVSGAAAPHPKPLYLPEKFTPYHFQMSGTFPIPD